MTIVYLVYELINSGPENVLYDICANLDRTHYKPIVVTLRSTISENTIEPKFQQLGIEIYHFSFSTLQIELRTSWVARKIEEFLKDEENYIVHAHGHHPTLIASHFKNPSICTIHCISGEDYVLKKGRLMGSYMSWRFKHNIANLDCSVAISDYMSKYYKKCSDKIIKIYNGVGTEPSKGNRTGLRKKLCVEEGAFVIAVIGSVIPRKNTKYIIEQLKQSSNRDFLCLIVGTGLDLDICKQIAGDDNRFRFEGFRNNVLDYLNIADIYISASYSEGLPLSVLEAINVGVPVLLSDIPPHKEIETAMQISSVKTFSLSNNQLLPVFDNMKNEIFDISALQVKAHELFSAKTMAEKYEKVYESLNK